MVQIYKNKQYCIYSNGRDAYIVHNKNKDFEIGHTHIANYHTAKYIINLSLHNTIPNKNIGNYLLESLIRISDNDDYVQKIKTIKEKRCCGNAPQRKQPKCSKQTRYRKSDRR